MARLTGPTVPPPRVRGLGTVLSRNIEALAERRREEEAAASRQDRLAERITRFVGSMPFIYIHMVLFGAWTASNFGWIPGAPRFDPTFVALGTFASVEAIFLSTFVLISQNRASTAADRRADLDLQINLLAEHEVTRLVSLTTAIAEHLGIDQAGDPELAELEQDVAPEAVLDSLDEAEAEQGPLRHRAALKSGARPRAEGLREE